MCCISVFSAVVGDGTAICRALVPMVGIVHRPIRRPAMLMCATGAKTIYKAVFRIIGKSAYICSRIASRSGTLVPVMSIVGIPISGYVYVGNVIHVDIDDCLSTIGGVNHCKGLGKISHIRCRQKLACKVKLAVRSKFISSRSIQVELEHICFALTEYHTVYCGVVIIYGAETRRNKSSPIAAVHIDGHTGTVHGNAVVRHFADYGLGKTADVYGINGSLGGGDRRCGNLICHLNNWMCDLFIQNIAVTYIKSNFSNVSNLITTFGLVFEPKNIFFTGNKWISLESVSVFVSPLNFHNIDTISIAGYSAYVGGGSCNRCNNTLNVDGVYYFIDIKSTPAFSFG